MAKDNKKKEPEKPKGEEEGEKEEKKNKEEKEDGEEGAEEPKETTPTRRLTRPFQIVSCQSLSKKVWINSHNFMPDTPKKVQWLSNILVPIFWTKNHVPQASLKYINAKYVLKNSQTGLSQNHPKHGFLQVSQIIPLRFLPYIWVIYFFNSIIYSCF